MGKESPFALGFMVARGAQGGTQKGGGAGGCGKTKPPGAMHGTLMWLGCSVGGILFHGLQPKPPCCPCRKGGAGPAPHGGCLNGACSDLKGGGWSGSGILGTGRDIG